MKQQFLPICRQDMIDRGWEQVDFVYISGDAYVDHPSFGHAIITRELEAFGYKVGIIAQPDWKDIWRTKAWVPCVCGQYGFDGQSLFCIKKTKKQRFLYSGRRNGKKTGLCDNRLQ